VLDEQTKDRLTIILQMPEETLLEEFKLLELKR
jgi:hypothetical protein